MPTLCYSFIPSSSLLLSVNQTAWKTGRGWRWESLLLMPHMCFFRASVAYHPGGLFLYWWGDVIRQHHTSVCRCLRAETTRLWDVIQALFALTFCYCMRSCEGRHRSTTALIKSQRIWIYHQSGNPVAALGLIEGVKWLLFATEPMLCVVAPTYTQLPSPSRSSYGWCTSLWAGRQPQIPGWLTVPEGQQTPGCWRSSGYILQRRTNSQVTQLVTVTFTAF